VETKSFSAAVAGCEQHAAVAKPATPATAMCSVCRLLYASVDCALSSALHLQAIFTTVRLGRCSSPSDCRATATFLCSCISTLYGSLTFIIARLSVFSMGFWFNVRRYMSWSSWYGARSNAQATRVCMTFAFVSGAQQTERTLLSSNKRLKSLYTCLQDCLRH